MLNKLLITVSFFLLFGFQQTNIVLLKSISVKADYATIDNLSNIYLLNNDVIQKYDPQGTPMKSYSNKSLGKISTVDAVNPMKVLLFYRNFLQIVFLDNTLSQNGDPVSVQALGYPQAQLVCTSHNNGIWVYNQQNFELVRLNQDLQPINQTGNLARLLDVELKPNYMVEYNNRLYLNNPSTGILVFDVFGTYNKTIPLKGLSGFQFKEEQLVFYQQGHLNSFNMLTLEQSISVVPDSTAQAVLLGNHKLYSVSKETLGIYLLK